MKNFFIDFHKSMSHIWNDPYDQPLGKMLVFAITIMIMVLVFLLTIITIGTKGVLLVFLIVIAGVVTLFYHFLDSILGIKKQND